MGCRLRIRKIEDPSAFEDILMERWPRKRQVDKELADLVESVIEEVKEHGDRALIDFTERFDSVKLNLESIRVRQEEIDKAYKAVSHEFVSAIEFAKDRVRAYQKELLDRLSFDFEREGVKIQNRFKPIRRLGCYVPAGEAKYPSSLVMTVVPAKVAGVPEIVVCSPPRFGGNIDPSILVAAEVCGVDEIYKVGGSHAIAAMAYGTETIKPVDKLVGAGNKYVVMAKNIISRYLPVDFPAGPTEIVILADDSAEPRMIALDMISQAEHKDGVSVLITTSKNLADNVVQKLDSAAQGFPNKEMVSQNLSRHGFILVCKNIEVAINCVNDFAPEHLEIMVKDASETVDKITTAGVILVGRYTPVSASDYCLGTDHILPTGGFSRVYSGLSVLNYTKIFSVVRCSREGLLGISRTTGVLARNEELYNHALALEGRFRND